MEPPITLDDDAVRDEKLKVLKSLAPIGGADAAHLTVRGQYRAGAIDGQPVPGYLEEIDAAAASDTETFVAVKADVENWRWAGVPFYLRTGKRLPSRASEIVVQFRTPPHELYPESAGAIHPNRLVMRLQPDEGIRLLMMSKQRGPGEMKLRQTALDLSFNETFGGRSPDAYERLLLDVIRGRPTLFMRVDEVAGGVALDRPDPGRLEPAGNRAQVVHQRQLGTECRRGTDRARRPHLARGRAVMTHPVVAEVTERIRARSEPRRRDYLDRIAAQRRAGHPPRPAVLRQPRARLRREQCGREAGARGWRAAEHRHRHGLQRHAVGAPAAAGLPGHHQGCRAGRGRHGAGRRRRPGDVRRRHPGPGRHGAVAVQPRRHRDVHGDRSFARHVRRGALPRCLRQDRAGPADRRACVRPPAGAVRAGRADDLRIAECREVTHPPAVRRRQGRPRRSCSRPRPSPITGRAPARSTAPPTATRC